MRNRDELSCILTSHRQYLLHQYEQDVVDLFVLVIFARHAEVYHNVRLQRECWLQHSERL